jgi:hypothetical protein
LAAVALEALMPLLEQAVTIPFLAPLLPQEAAAAALATEAQMQTALTVAPVVAPDITL